MHEVGVWDTRGWWCGLRYAGIRDGGVCEGGDKVGWGGEGEKKSGNRGESREEKREWEMVRWDESIVAFHLDEEDGWVLNFRNTLFF